MDWQLSHGKVDFLLLVKALLTITTTYEPLNHKYNFTFS